MECNCSICKSACTEKPGWFLPGEAEKAATFLSLSFEDFFNKFLGVDYWVNYSSSEVNNGKDILILAPATKKMRPGSKYPRNPNGECIFFNDGCDIHKVKPFECREYIHGEDTGGRHEFVADQWIEHQEVIKNLWETSNEPEEITQKHDIIFGTVENK